MRRHTKSSLLWGAIGALTFLVLAQGYRIVVGPLPTGSLGMVVIGLTIGGTVGTVSYLTEPWLATKGRT